MTRLLHRGDRPGLGFALGVGPSLSRCPRAKRFAPAPPGVRSPDYGRRIVGRHSAHHPTERAWGAIFDLLCDGDRAELRLTTDDERRCGYSADDESRCSATTGRGSPCRRFALSGSEFCFVHQPQNAERMREHAAAMRAAR